MGVVTVSSSASEALARLCANHTFQRSGTIKFKVLAFKSDKSDNSSMAARRGQIPLPMENSRQKKRVQKNATGTDAPPCSLEVDFNEAAAKLETIYKLSPVSNTGDVNNGSSTLVRRRRQRKRNVIEKDKSLVVKPVVRNQATKPRRLTLLKRVELRQIKEESGTTVSKQRREKMGDGERIEELLREYSSGTDLMSMEWKKMKIPPVLTSSEHKYLFNLMQPMKTVFEVKESLEMGLGREATEMELADSIQMDVVQVRKQMAICRAARNKLIKHNLRLVLFVVNKYFQDFANNRRFHDLCQEGAKGLIVAIERFEPKKNVRLSTYSLFWIRHAIIRSMTVSSFTRVSFGLESVRVEIQKVKLELLVQLQRQPTEEEIIQRVGISPKRYHEVMKASSSVASLHAKNLNTQEEWIYCITEDQADVNGRQRALSRLALDDVLDSLKPKESLVIRQRYGLDGKGDRTLGEIAGNLSISREMVRKYEAKALMKLKHPARVDYLRRCVLSTNT